MWIIDKQGQAINTDLVVRFRKSNNNVVADLVGVHPTIAVHVIGDTTIEEITKNIISGTKIMEVR